MLLVHGLVEFKRALLIYQAALFHRLVFDSSPVSQNVLVTSDPPLISYCKLI